jgi:hypothetical protein
MDADRIPGEGGLPSHDDLTDEEWQIIEQRMARRDLATDEEVEAVFNRYR